MKYNTKIRENEAVSKELREELKKAKGLSNLHRLKGFNPAKLETIKIYEVLNGFTERNLKELIDFENNKIAFIVRIVSKYGVYYYNDFDCWGGDFRGFNNYMSLDFFRKNKKEKDISYNVYVLIQDIKYCVYRKPYEIDYKNGRFYKKYSAIYSKVNDKYIGPSDYYKLDKNGYILPIQKMEALKWEARKIRNEKNKNAFLNYAGFESDLKEIESIKNNIILKFTTFKNSINNIYDFSKICYFYNFNDYKITKNGFDFNGSRIKGIKAIINYIDDVISKINDRNFKDIKEYQEAIAAIKKWSFEETFKEFNKIKSLEKLIDFVRKEKNLPYRYTGDLLKEKIVIIENDNIKYICEDITYIIDLDTNIITKE